MPRFYVSLIVAALAGLTVGAGGALAQDSERLPMPSNMTTPLERSRQAIIECRERRQSKELPGYKESAECASPRIFAAWRDANYPHMDLITAWLNAREAASAQVDQKAITPAEFERQMADITRRLTAEEQRRRSGLTVSADRSLELQLPPSTQVLGVATPPGQEKLAKKKSAEAIAAAAATNSGYVPPSSGTSVQSMGQFSSLDSQKPNAGVGGPFVPVGGTRTAALTGPGAGGFYAQLAAQRSEADARAVFRMLQQQYPAILGSRDAVIRRADSSQGTYYRVEIGPLTAGQADQLCGSLKAAGAQCATQYE